MLIKEKTTNAALHEADQKYYLPTFKRFPLAFRRGEDIGVVPV